MSDFSKLKLWYNALSPFKKDTIREIGKHILDLSKIVFALAFIGPLAKGFGFSFITIIFVAVISTAGFYLYNKGAKDE